MKKKPNQFTHFMAAFLLSVSTGVSAEPGALANNPLVVSSTIDPNLMITLDSSGSMSNIVPEAPFDPDIDYANCPAARTLAAGNTTINIRVNTDGTHYFRRGSTDYNWGTVNVGAGRDERCFSDDGSYTRVRLYGNSGNSPKQPSGYAYSVYSGNYLNWYFSNASNDGSIKGTVRSTLDYHPQGRKPGTQTRLEIAKTAVNNLLTPLSNFRVGFAKFGPGSNGASIVRGLLDIDDPANRLLLKSDIAAMTNGGSTPLAETMAHLGRYFVQGYEDASLSYIDHTDPSEPVKTAQAKDIFTNPSKDEPDWLNDSEPKSGDPAIQQWCQKNFIVALTDGQNQSDVDLPPILQDFDGDCSAGTPANDALIADGRSCGTLTRDRKDGQSYSSSSSSSDYLDDVVQALYEIDLRPDLVDGNGDPVKNNVTTFTVGFADDQVRNDPLMPDTGLASGSIKNFLMAGSSKELETAFAQALNSITSQTASVGTVAFNSTRLSENSELYLARFNTGRWKGELIAFPLTGRGEVKPSVWEAGALLDARNLTTDPRLIYTYNEVLGTGVEFKVGSLPASMIADLDSLDGDNDGSADNRAGDLVNYLRGDRSLEGLGDDDLRVRESRLGDIVNSEPLFVGVPETAWPDYVSGKNEAFGALDDTWSDYRSSRKDRRQVLYVGGNDGMLHAFAAGKDALDRGQEIMAYIPNLLASTDEKAGLHYLADREYLHQFYVDLTPSVSDVYLNDEWKTILVGGLRAGGRGFFVLDVTNPEDFGKLDAFGAPIALPSDVVVGEFGSDIDPNLGYTYSRPQVVKVDTSNNDSRWAVITGNGYNSTGDGRAKLLIVYLDPDLSDGWTLGDDYEWIDTERDEDTTNGLSAPALIDTDDDGVIDRAYAGDLFGNMWAFDLSNGSRAIAFTDKGTPVPLFTTDGKETQAITTSPLIISNPELASSQKPGVQVSFGTGRYLTYGDISNTDRQAYYSVTDVGIGDLNKGNLEQRQFELDDINDPPDPSLRVSTGDPIDWTDNNNDGGEGFGWFVELDQPDGERVLSESQLRRGTLFFNTSIPETESCRSGGTGWLITVNALTGLAQDFGVFDANNDGVIDSQDKYFTGKFFGDGMPGKSGILGDKQYTPSSSGEVFVRDIDVGASAREGRLGWQELISPR